MRRGCVGLIVLVQTAFLCASDARAQGVTPVDSGRPASAAPAEAKAPEPSGPAAQQTQAQPGTAPALEALGIPCSPTEACTERRRVHLEADWDYGFRLRSEDDNFHLHIGGNAQVDSNWLIGPQALFALPGGAANGVGNASATFLRRARLRMEGDLYSQFDYIVEYDFAHAENENSGLQPNSFQNIAGSPTPCNVWIQIREVPVLGNVRFGNQVKPIGMTNNTYQGFLPFLERADNQDGFYGPFDSGFDLGLTARNWADSERLTWQFGIYRPSIDTFATSLNKFSIGGRVTALPWYADEGRRLAHLGVGCQGGELVQNQLRVRARPLLRNAPGYAVPILVDTGEIPGSRQYTIAPELAVVLGPWTLQAEWAGQFLTDAIAPSGQSQGTVFYHGGYIQILYFLTGEHQAYVKRDGVFGRIIPTNDYHVKKHDDHWSLGAWQIGSRFSYLDLNDKGVQGGLVYNYTTGLNWFLNPNMKFQFNHILEYRNQPGVTPGWINGVGLRGAYDF